MYSKIIEVEEKHANLEKEERKRQEKCANIFQKKHAKEKEKEENIQGNNKYIIKIDINHWKLY